MKAALDAEALDALQRDIYREKVERARLMTVAERLASVFECSDLGLEMAFGQIRTAKPTATDDEVWAEVGARIERVRQVEDRGIYSFKAPRC